MCQRILRPVPVIIFVFSLILLPGCQTVTTVTVSEQPSPSPQVLSVPSPTVIPSPSPTALSTSEAKPTTSQPEQPPSSPGLTASLQGLPFDQFLEESFKQLMLRDPESVTIEGLSGYFGVRNDQLTNLSDAYIRQTHELQKAIFALLNTYDRSTLPPAQRVSHDAYAWYLDDLIQGQAFMYYDYPVNPLTILGVQYLTESLFTEYQPVNNQQEAEDYLSRLSQVETKFDQVIEGLKLRQQAGIIAPRFVIQACLGDIRAIANSQPKSTSFYTVFQKKVNALTDINAAEKQALLDQAVLAIQDSVISGYASLAQTLEQLESEAPERVGVWQYPNGEAYYNYLLRHQTSTELTADDIHQLGLEELERINTEMRAIFDQLGYTPELNLEQLFKRVAQDSGFLAGSQIVEGYRALIDQASQNLEDIFDLQPAAGLEVAGIPASSAFYSAAALDGSRPGIFYAPTSASQPQYLMPTIAYHEAIPGHHFQIAIQREMSLPLFRNIVVFNAYAEGWALYTERLAWEQGWYQEDPYGNLGRLQYEAWRAARLVVDTGIHARRWTYNQAVDFLVENAGLNRGHMNFEVTRYCVWPGQATGYSIGYLKLLELRQAEQARLGAQFDPKIFHHTVLSSGSVPLDILEEIIALQAKNSD